MEVLQHNTGAVSVYRKLGFEPTREFYYFKPEIGQINNEVKPLGLRCTLQPIDINAYGSIFSFWDFKPSWQNTLASINRTMEDFICLGAFAEGRLIGYGIFESASGDVSQMAVDKPYRCKGIGSLLLQEMLKVNQGNSIKIVNTDICCDSMTAFLESKGVGPAGKQFEMMKKL